MTVLITGATGFVGLNMVHALVVAGHDTVMLAPSLPPAVAERDWMRGVRFVVGDVRSTAHTARAFAIAPITHLVHAAPLTPDTEMEMHDPATIAPINLGLAPRRPGLWTHRLQQTIGWLPDSSDVAAKASAYLAWRRGPEGQAQDGTPGADAHLGALT